MISSAQSDLSMKSRSAPLSHWASGLGESIRPPRKQLKVPFAYDGGTIACVLDYVSLWFVLEWDELRVAIRSCFDPQGIDSARMVTSSENECRFVVRVGLWSVRDSPAGAEGGTRDPALQDEAQAASARVNGGLCPRPCLWRNKEERGHPGQGSLHAKRTCFGDCLRLLWRSEGRHTALLSESHFPERILRHNSCGTCGNSRRRVAGNRDGPACGQRAYQVPGNSQLRIIVAPPKGSPSRAAVGAKLRRRRRENAAAIP